MDSPDTLEHLRRERRRRTFRRWRRLALFVLFLAVSFWGYSNHRADNFTFAWDRPVRVLVLAVVDPHTDAAEEVRQGFLQRFLTGVVPGEGNLEGVKAWFEKEHRRHTGRSGPPIEFIPRGPFRAAEPPPLPAAGDAWFLERWRSVRSFLGYFEETGEREKLSLGAYDAAIFVYLYDEDEASRYSRHVSVATRRTRRGVVFSPFGPRHVERCCVLLAHELCHALGASDKYEGERSLFPDGFADPDLSPRYPQERAEIMALGIPVKAGAERRAEDLGDCVMGRKTAEEIGWLPQYLPPSSASSMNAR